MVLMVLWVLSRMRWLRLRLWVWLRVWLRVRLRLWGWPCCLSLLRFLVRLNCRGRTRLTHMLLRRGGHWRCAIGSWRRSRMRRLLHGRARLHVSRVLGRDGAGAGKISRPRGGRNRRIAAVGAGAQRRIAACGLHMLLLCRCVLNVALMRRSRLLCTRLGSNPAAAAAVADAVDADVVDHRFVVHVSDVHRTDIHYGAVVVQMLALPVAAFVAVTAVAVAVIDAAVESDVRPPIAAVPNVCAVCPPPIPGSPQKSHLRRLNPGTGHPVIILAVIAPCPIAGSPEISVCRNRRLDIDRQCRGRDIDRDAD